MPAQPGRLLAVPRNLQSHVAIGALPEEGRTWRFFSALGAALRLLWLLHRPCCKNRKVLTDFSRGFQQPITAPTDRGRKATELPVSRITARGFFFISLLTSSLTS